MKGVCYLCALVLKLFTNGSTSVSKETNQTRRQEARSEQILQEIDPYGDQKSSRNDG